MYVRMALEHCSLDNNDKAEREEREEGGKCHGLLKFEISNPVTHLPQQVYIHYAFPNSSISHEPRVQIYEPMGQVLFKPPQASNA